MSISLPDAIFFRAPRGKIENPADSANLDNTRSPSKSLNAFHTSIHASLLCHQENFLYRTAPLAMSCLRKALCRNAPRRLGRTASADQANRSRSNDHTRKGRSRDLFPSAWAAGNRMRCPQPVRASPGAVSNRKRREGSDCN